MARASLIPSFLGAFGSWDGVGWSHSILVSWLFGSDTQEWKEYSLEMLDALLSKNHRTRSLLSRVVVSRSHARGTTRTSGGGRVVAVWLGQRSYGRRRGAHLGASGRWRRDRLPDEENKVWFDRSNPQGRDCHPTSSCSSNQTPHWNGSITPTKRIHGIISFLSSGMDLLNPTSRLNQMDP